MPVLFSQEETRDLLGAPRDSSASPDAAGSSETTSVRQSNLGGDVDSDDAVVGGLPATVGQTPVDCDAPSLAQPLARNKHARQGLTAALLLYEKLRSIPSFLDLLNVDEVERERQAAYDAAKQLFKVACFPRKVDDEYKVPCGALGTVACLGFKVRIMSSKGVVL